MNNRPGNSAQGHLRLSFPCQPFQAPSLLRRRITAVVPYLFVLLVAAAVIEALDALDLHYPKVSKEKLKELAAAKRVLLGGKQ